MVVSESGFTMLPPESKCWATDEQMLAYQDAIEYGIDARQLEYALTLTPVERLRRHDAALALVSAARKAGFRYYGVNPRSPEAS
jgi:hypothetical protein